MDLEPPYLGLSVIGTYSGGLTEDMGDLALLPWSGCGEQSLAIPGESPLPLAFLPW
jgi:hypothetical protein